MDSIPGGIIAMIHVIWETTAAFALAKHEIIMARNRYEELQEATNAVKKLKGDVAELLQSDSETMRGIDRTLDDAEFLCDMYHGFVVGVPGTSTNPETQATPARRQRVGRRWMAAWVVRNRDAARVYEQAISDTLRRLESLRKELAELSKLKEDMDRGRANQNREDAARRNRRKRHFARALRERFLSAHAPIKTEELELVREEAGKYCVMGEHGAVDMSVATWLRTQFLATEGDIRQMC